MSIPVVQKHDPWGQVGSALGNALSQGGQLAMKEGADARSEQRRMMNDRSQAEWKESRLKDALSNLYNDPKFKEGSFDEKRALVTQTIAPIDTALAKHIADADIDSFKAQNPAPAKGQVAPQQQKMLDLYRQSDQYKSAQPSQVHTDVLEMTGNQQLANSMRAAKQSELSGDIKQKELIQDKAKHDENIAMKYHERSEDFMKDAKEQANQADNAELGIRQMSEAMNRKNNPEFGYGAFRAGAASFLPETLMNQFLSEDEAVFEAAIPNLLEGMKDLFGVRLSDADLRLVRGKLPSLGKSKEANEQILGFLQNMANIKKLKYKLARDEEKKYPKNRPASFVRDVEDQYEEQAGKLKDKYFAEFRLPSKDAAGVKKAPMAKNSVRMVGPDGRVLDFPKDKQEAINYMKNQSDYLILQES